MLELTERKVSATSRPRSYQKASPIPGDAAQQTFFYVNDAGWLHSRAPFASAPTLLKVHAFNLAELNFHFASQLLDQKHVRGVKRGRVPEGELIIEVMLEGNYYILEFYGDGSILFALRGDHEFEGVEIRGEELDAATTAIVNGRPAV